MNMNFYRTMYEYIHTYIHTDTNYNNVGVAQAHPNKEGVQISTDYNLLDFYYYSMFVSWLPADGRLRKLTTWILQIPSYFQLDIIVYNS